MKRILITGANGFIGQNLINKLKKDNEIFGLDRSITKQLDEKHSIVADIGDFNKIDNIFSDNKFDILIHLAAIVHKNNADTSEENYDYINYECAVHLFDLCKEKNIKVIFASTIEVYGDVGCKVVNESTKCNPMSFYAKAKFKAEQYLQNNYNNYLILRFAAVYGEQFTLNIDKRIFLKKDKLSYYFKDGKYTFDFCSIKNICDFINYAISSEKCSGIYILSDSNSMSALDIIKIFKKHDSSIKVLKLPYKLASCVINILDMKNKFSKNKDSFFSKRNFDKLFQSVEFDNQKANSIVQLKWSIENTLYGD